MFAFLQKYSRNYRLLSVNTTFRLGEMHEMSENRSGSRIITTTLFSTPGRVLVDPRI